MPIPLLLLHGAGDDGACWRPFVERVRSRGLADLTVRTPDAPAHGGRRAEPGHTLAWADQLAEALDHAEGLSGGVPIVVGGHSMGAAVALGVAAARSDLVAGLWLEDPPLPGSMADDDTEAPAQVTDLSDFHRWFAELQALPLEQVIAVTRAEHPGWDPAEYEPRARAKHSIDLDGWVAPVPWVVTGWAARARVVSCPTVVAAGEAERGGLLAAAVARELATLPGWSVHRLRAGHDVRRDAPNQTADLLADLIRAVSR